MLNLFNRDVVVEEREHQPWGYGVAVEGRYRPLVDRLEREAEAAPARYRRRVLLAGSLGYLAIGLLAAAFLAVAAGLVWLMISIGRGNFVAAKGLVLIGLLLFGMVRALWVKSAPPQGHRITEKEAPRLFAAIEELRRKLGGPRIHEVLITDELNAAIVQLPRLGPFGWYRNYLILGLPLLEALPEDEVKSVIAHELGHFAGTHGRLASSVSRVRMSWIQLSERVQSGISAILLRRFFRWYGPWFNAYSFVLARSNEYEADRAAATATSAATAGNALVRLTLESDRMGRYWRDIYKRAHSEPAPAATPYARFGEYFRTAHDSDEARQTMRCAFRRKTGLEDTHPCLNDRLKALGVDSAQPPVIEASAAQALLGRTAEQLAAEFDSDWKTRYADWWREVYEARQADLEELAGLEAKAAAGELDRDGRYRIAELVRSVRGFAEAAPHYDALAEEDSDDVNAAYYAAECRLRSSDPDGVAKMEAVAVRDPNYALGAYSLLADYHFRKDDEEAEMRAWDSFGAAEKRNAEIRAELNALPRDCALIPADYCPEWREQIREALEECQGFKRVYAAFRPLAQGGHQQIILFEEKSDADVDYLVDCVGDIFGPMGPWMGIPQTFGNIWLNMKMEKLDGSRLL